VSTLLSLVIVPVFYALLVTVRDRMWGGGGPGTGAGAAGAAVPSAHGPEH
jgi:hypothetical protein